MRITLRAARVNAKLYQAEAAKLIGVDKKTLGNWEKGITFPKTDKIPIICAVYKREYDEIDWARK